MDLDLLVSELAKLHGAHTVILYGSRARGDAGDDSDVDIAAFADVDAPVRDARVWNGVYLDAFVYPTQRLEAPEADLRRLHDGKVLRDDRGLATAFQRVLTAIDRTGPEPLPADESTMRRAWAHKTLERARRGDTEGNYRRIELLCRALEDHFALRARWYRGSKRALAELGRDDPRASALFEAAFAPGAPIDAIAPLVELVYGPAPAD